MQWRIEVVCSPCDVAGRERSGQALRLLGERRMAAQAARVTLTLLRGHLRQLTKHPGTHSTGVEARLPIPMLLDVAGPACTRRECALDGAEMLRRGTLRRERTRPVPLQKRGVGVVAGRERIAADVARPDHDGDEGKDRKRGERPCVTSPPDALAHVMPERAEALAFSHSHRMGYRGSS